MLSGRYRSCWLRRNWTEESGGCRLPGCDMVPGDVAHLLSAECPALQVSLTATLNHLKSLLAPQPLLLNILMSALTGDRESITTFFLDPSTEPQVIQLSQLYGRAPVLGPLFQVSRAWIWSAHRTRMRLLGLERYLM
jgi:hypothetical protein